jgi:hypothetical protein
MGRVGSAFDNALAERASSPHLEDGASLAQHLLAHQTSGQNRYLRVHRGFLQSPEKALRARVPEPC